jgi:hypothetical protein
VADTGDVICAVLAPAKPNPAAMNSTDISFDMVVVGSTIQRNTFVLMLQFREGGMYGSNGTPRSFRFPEVGTLATLEGWRIA